MSTSFLRLRKRILERSSSHNTERAFAHQKPQPEVKVPLPAKRPVNQVRRLSHDEERYLRCISELQEKKWAPVLAEWRLSKHIVKDE